MPKNKPRAPRADKEQSRLFIKKAREIGANSDLSASDELLEFLHKKPPEPHVAPKRRRRSTR